MSDSQEKTFVCEVCGQVKTAGEVFPLAIVHESVFKMIQRGSSRTPRERLDLLRRS